jgi:DNA-binding transcriptional LysR family regulator
MLTSQDPLGRVWRTDPRGDRALAGGDPSRDQGRRLREIAERALALPVRQRGCQDPALVPRPRERRPARRRLNLNAIMTLDALLEEKSPTGAAKKLGITQSAVSHTLKELRDFFGDPLLSRTARGMVLTPRALELAEPIRKGLETIDAAVQRAEVFDPRRTSMTFTVAMTDHVGISFLPDFFAALAREAPGVDLRVMPVVRRVERQLEAGEIDLLFSLSSVPIEGLGLYRQRLFDERFVCLVRRDHPKVGRRLTLEEYCALDHLLIAPRGGRGLVDQLLDENGLERRVALTVPQFLLAPFIVAESDLILTLAERVARRFESLLPLRIVPPPLRIPEYVCSQVWHERHHANAGHRWIRALIARVAKDAGG